MGQRWTRSKHTEQPEPPPLDAEDEKKLNILTTRLNDFQTSLSNLDGNQLRLFVSETFNSQQDSPEEIHEENLIAQLWTQIHEHDLLRGTYIPCHVEIELDPSLTILTVKRDPMDANVLDPRFRDLFQSCYTLNFVKSTLVDQ